MNVAVEKQLFPGLNLHNDISPDIYELEEKGIQPNNEFVISRDKKKNTVSLYGDNIWDFTPYVTNVSARRKIYFEKNIPISLIPEAKRLLFLVMLFGHGRKGAALSTNTLYGYFLIIKRFSIFSFNFNVRISDVFSNAKLLKMFAEKSNNYKDVRLLHLLDKIDNVYSMIDFKSNKKITNLFYSKKKKYNQTLIIPSSILSESINQRWEQFDEVNECSKLLIEFLQLYIESKSNIQESKRKLFINDIFFKGKWSKLGFLFMKYNIKKLSNIGNFIYRFQHTCRHLILAYSGMRLSESLSLKINCCKEENETFFLLGQTSKLEASSKDVKWVTSKKILPIIDLLSDISVILAAKHNIDKHEIPLFITTLLLSYKKGDMNKGLTSRSDKDESLPLDDSKLLISESDIKEIQLTNSFNPHVNYSDMMIGKKWIFKAHQYRRSLCVYALQSEIVSIGSLQFQFKHLFREMTLYYGNGATQAKKLFSVPRNHIAMDFDDVKLEMDTLSYIKNVLFSDEELFGSYGKLVDNNGSLDLNKLNILELREKTLKKFKNGEISYKETALGGCISKELCNNRLTRSIYACADCDGAILKKSKIERVIKRQESFLSCLDKNSIEYRTELDDLNILKKRKDKLLKDRNEQKFN